MTLEEVVRRLREGARGEGLRREDGPRRVGEGAQALEKGDVLIVTRLDRLPASLVVPISQHAFVAAAGWLPPLKPVDPPTGKPWPSPEARVGAVNRLRNAGARTAAGLLLTPMRSECEAVCPRA